VPSKEKDKANAITVGDHTVTYTNVKNAHRCPAANVERKTKQANHPTALTRTMKVRIGPHPEAVSMSLGTPKAICFILFSVVMVFLPQSKKLWLLLRIRTKGEAQKFHGKILISQSDTVTTSIRR
jgi:hypothetical protein